MKKLLSTLMITMLLFSSQVSAGADDADWKPVSASAQANYKLLVNVKTFQREGDVVNVTMRYAYLTPQVFPFLNIKYDYMERRFAFQCKDRKMVPLENNYYLGENKVHSINLSGGNPFQPKGQNLVPQSVSAGTLEDEALTQSCDFQPTKK